MIKLDIQVGVTLDKCKSTSRLNVKLREKSCWKKSPFLSPMSFKNISLVVAEQWKSQCTPIVLLMPLCFFCKLGTFRTISSWNHPSDLGIPSFSPSQFLLESNPRLKPHERDTFNRRNKFDAIPPTSKWMREKEGNKKWSVEKERITVEIEETGKSYFNFQQPWLWQEWSTNIGNSGFWRCGNV